LFITSKLDGEFQRHDRAIAGLDECLQQLQMDYVDLLLISLAVATAQRICVNLENV
jgi:diketogulonate reductase-like aldo/keto reductase